MFILLVVFSEWRLKATYQGHKGCERYPKWIWDPMHYICAMGCATRTKSFSRRDGDGFVPPIQPDVCNTSQRADVGLSLSCFLFWRLS